jgi:parvulin-like peptidyl-prolyl isomerase
MLATESDAKTIEDQLRKRRSLATLAKEFSTEETQKQTPHVLWIRKGDSPIFESAFKMKVGTHSPILKSEFGFHIFEVIARRPARNRNYPDVKDEIRRILLEKRQQAAYLSWLDTQLRRSRIFKDQALISSLKIETRAER